MESNIRCSFSEEEGEKVWRKFAFIIALYHDRLRNLASVLLHIIIYNLIQ